MKIKRLDINKLKNGLPGITKAIGETMIEACNVCYSSQNIINSAIVSVSGEFTEKYEIELFKNITQQLINSYQDEEVTTEQGALCIGIALIIENTNYTIIQRSMKGTRFDYWLGKKKSNTLPFSQADARLEISGIRRGADKDVHNRVQNKVNRLKNSTAQNLPCYIVVVEFSSSVSKVKKV